MPENFPFAREDVFPSWFADRIQDFLSAAETNLRLTRKSGTTVQVVPDTALGIAAVAVDGRWRFIEETIQREHPGGSKGTYIVWAVAEDNDVDDTPKPHTDHTNYAFDLRITSGADPSGSGVVVFEKIGEIDWSGSKIEAVRQTLNSVTGPMIADGALSGEGDVEWKREPNGAWVPQLKTDSVTAAEIAAGAVGASEVANALKPSAGAAAGTEALRALGTSNSTAAAGNDSRLSDERTPKKNSVTWAKFNSEFLNAFSGALADSYETRAPANEMPAPSSMIVRISGTGAAEIKGIDVNNYGRIVIYEVQENVTFVHNSGSITGSHRLKLAGGANFVANANDVIMFIWYSTAWLEVSRSANG